MSKLITRGTALQEYTAFCSSNGQRTVEAVFRCAWSDTVCEEMSWQKDPAGFGNGSLEGTLLGISLIMEPNAKNLKDYTFDLTISKVGKFKHVLTKDDHHELEYTITTVAEDAVEVLDRYLQKCGPADDRGQAKITFNAEEQQGLVDEGEEVVEKTRGRRKAQEAVQ